MSNELREDVKRAGTMSYGRFPPQAFKPHYVTPIRIRLIKGEYKTSNGTVGYVKVWKHYNRRTRKYQICSSTWVTDPNTGMEVRANDGKQCVGCYLMYDNRNSMTPGGVQIPRMPLSIQRHYVFSLFVMNDFHLDPTRRDGSPLGTDDEGKPKFRRVMCTRHSDCQGCQRGQEKEWGRRMRWDLAKKYVEILLAHLDQNDRVCASCGSSYDEDKDSGGLYSKILCPSCGGVMIENAPVDTRSSMLSTEARVRCDRCHSVVTPTEELACTDCQSARRPDIYDADFWVRKSSSDAKSDIVVTKIRIGPPHKRINPDDFKPLDLLSTMAPDSIEVQCQIHNVPNPFIPGAASHKFGSYTSNPNEQPPASPQQRSDDGY